jgi:hypothetical protein
LRLLFPVFNTGTRNKSSKEGSTLLYREKKVNAAQGYLQIVLKLKEAHSLAI